MLRATAYWVLQLILEYRRLYMRRWEALQLHVGRHQRYLHYCTSFAAWQLYVAQRITHQYLPPDWGHP